MTLVRLSKSHTSLGRCFMHNLNDGGNCHVKHCCVARYGHVILNGLFSATRALWMSKLGVVVYGYC